MISQDLGFDPFLIRSWTVGVLLLEQVLGRLTILRDEKGRPKEGNVSQLPSYRGGVRNKVLRLLRPSAGSRVKVWRLLRFS